MLYGKCAREHKYSVRKNNLKRKILRRKYLEERLLTVKILFRTENILDRGIFKITAHWFREIHFRRK